MGDHDEEAASLRTHPPLAPAQLAGLGTRPWSWEPVFSCSTSWTLKGMAMPAPLIPGPAERAPQALACGQTHEQVNQGAGVGDRHRGRGEVITGSPLGRVGNV